MDSNCIKIKECEKHGSYKSQQFCIFGTTFESPCPKCEAEQTAKENEENKQTQEKAKIANLIERGIEPEFFNASLENYKAENESEKKALQACKDMADGKIKKLMLLGSNGTGKTMLACSLALMLGGVRITMFELSAKIRSSYSNGDFENSELNILNHLLSYNFICIDEVGRTKGSDAERNWLSYLIDKAHTRNIRLMIISNRQTAKNLSVERRSEAIEHFFDNDVISRLHENTQIVEVKGRDRRAAVATAV